MHDEDLDSDFDKLLEEQCQASGTLIRKDGKVAVHMQWHMAHKLSPTYQKSFLKLRCRNLGDVFGDLKGVQGVGAIVLADNNALIKLTKKFIVRPTDCVMNMGFIWPDISDERWVILKEQFKEVFAPATMHETGGEVEESDNLVQIVSTFELTEKGVS